eukprot:TRINITY_DN514_c0_g2_i1.p1 TRINITY_DN514_c0_g2~~TRINITY_DN514_c0_g2_i1.p1  ORF type:complete len:333 (+),score=140.51 TRINITY_DN514_c0_g2_i1:37-999(+)
MAATLTEEQTQALKKQIEFYFSDSNYPRDKFMRTTAAENNGQIPIEVLLKFNKLKEITTDVETIANVVQSSDQLILSEDRKFVKRSAPLPETDTMNERSVYVKGFPEDEAGVTVDSVTKFFETHGKVLSVRPRRTKEKKFKGSIFIEFDTEETAKKVSDLKEVKWGEQTLTLLQRSEYYKQKKEENKQAKESKKRKADAPTGREKYTNEVRKGLVMIVTGLGEKTDRDELKDLFTGYGSVKYVEYIPADHKAFIRFADTDSAQNALKEYKEGDKEIAGGKVTATMLEGEAEDEYWQKNILNKPPKKGGFKGGFKRRKKNF